MKIIGLGTGRCGTRSLARLLGSQRGIDVQHERKPALLWDGEPDPGRHIRASDGDVAFYYLPHVDALRQEFDVRFVCLRRDRQETIRSFCRQLPRARNWFESHGQWSHSFPVIRQNSFERQVSEYYDMYYDRAAELEGDDFRVFQIETLNDPEPILKFCGIENPIVEPCHVGAGAP